MAVFRNLLAAALMAVPLAAAPALGDTTDTTAMKILRLDSGLRFGLIGGRKDRPAPTLFVLGHGLETMQQQPVYTEVARLPLKQGVLSVVLDPPCHGEDIRPGEPEGMEGWRSRLEHGEPFVQAFTTHARKVLDYLIRQGYSDPRRIAACGVSRGGFLAFHWAAVDPRVRTAAGVSPLVRLMALREFRGTPEPEKAEKLSLVEIAPKLAGRAVWVSIGNHDLRVDTDQVIAFTRAIVRAAARSNRPDQVIPVELIVAPTAGHRKIDQAHELLAAWILHQFGLAASGR